MEIAFTPKSLPAVGPPPTPLKTLSRWNQFLGTIASGVLLEDAMLKHYMSRADIEACCRSSHEERQRWDDARLAARRRKWSVFDLEDVFQRIAGGMKVTEAVQQVKGYICNDFNSIVITDPTLNLQYMAALKSRAMILAEDIIDISDDDSNDVIDGPKGQIPNNAAVGRSKLRVETRTRLMGSWFPKLFGDQKNNVQVNVQVNHAARLEEARARATTRKPTAPKGIPEHVIEAAFAESVSEEQLDTSWLDEKPDPALDTSWLEEK